MTDDNFDNQNDFDQFDNFDMNDTGQDFEEFQEEHKPKNKNKAIITVLFLVILGGIGFASYQYYFKPMLNAQHADRDDGVPPGGSYSADHDSLPPNVMSDDGTLPENPVADSLTPPAPPEVDSAIAPPVPPALQDDGTVPADISSQGLPTNTTNSSSDIENTALSNTLPAAVSDLPSELPVEAPSRVATPSETLVPQDMNETIKPSLPVSTTNSAEKPAAIATPETALHKVEEIATPVPAAAVAPATTEAPAAQITAPVVDAESSAKLQSLEQKVADLPSAATIAKLNSQIEALTQRLEALDKRTETLATTLQNRESDAPSAQLPVTHVPATEIEKPAIVAPKPVAKKAAPAKPKAKPVVRSSASGWVLRSAQPDAAWLSKPGSEEMVRYTVGQALPGAGKITAITQENGSWVLKTDSGVNVRP